MSQVDSRSISADHYAGTAAHISDDIDCYLKGNRSEQIPFGAYRSAKQLFEYARAGIIEDRRETPEGMNVDQVKGLSALLIVYRVLNEVEPAVLDKAIETRFVRVEEKINSHIKNLDMIIEKRIERVPTENLTELYNFFNELMNQGQQESEIEYALRSMPVGPELYDRVRERLERR